MYTALFYLIQHIHTHVACTHIRSSWAHDQAAATYAKSLVFQPGLMDEMVSRKVSRSPDIQHDASGIHNSEV